MKPQAEAEYREFVTAQLDHLCRFAYLLCRDWHRAEDAVQKALLKLYLHWNRVDHASPHAYVRRIVANNLRDEQRRLWFRRERSSERLPERATADHGQSRPGELSLLECVSRLPHRQRLAVLLRHWEDLSVEQTAQVMNCSVGAVKSQTSRGLATLRRLLESESSTQLEGAAL